MAHKSPPPFVAKIQRFLAIEFLTILSLAIIAGAIEFYFYKTTGISKDGNIFIFCGIFYLAYLFARLIIVSIKIVVSPNSPK